MVRRRRRPCLWSDPPAAGTAESRSRRKPVIKDPEKALVPAGKAETARISTQLVTRNAPKASTNAKAASDAARARAIRSALRKLKNNLTSATTIDMPGNSSVAYANYATVVKSVYEQAWMLPDGIASDDANTKVSVTIASDGTVISAQHHHAVRRRAAWTLRCSSTLDRVTFIAPFPEGATEKERTYIINFNLKAKRMLG